jgi:hypothetical protein
MEEKVEKEKQVRKEFAEIEKLSREDKADRVMALMKAAKHGRDKKGAEEKLEDIVAAMTPAQHRDCIEHLPERGRSKLQKMLARQTASVKSMTPAIRGVSATGMMPLRVFLADGTFVTVAIQV